MSNEQNVAIFVYGTLRDSAVQIMHIGREVKGAEDTLQEYGKSMWGPYPIIAPTKGSNIEGEVLTITEKELESVDRYEGLDSPSTPYVRKLVSLKSGQEAFVYVKGNKKGREKLDAENIN